MITAYHLNKPAIKWQVGFGDDILFGIGGDGRVRAYDTAHGKVLWTSTQGGDGALRASPVLYEVDGQEYMLTPLPADGAVMYVSFAVPRK